MRIWRNRVQIHTACYQVVFVQKLRLVALGCEIFSLIAAEPLTQETKSMFFRMFVRLVSSKGEGKKHVFSVLTVSQEKQGALASEPPVWKACGLQRPLHLQVLLDEIKRIKKY